MRRNQTAARTGAAVNALHTLPSLAVGAWGCAHAIGGCRLLSELTATALGSTHTLVLLPTGRARPTIPSVTALLQRRRREGKHPRECMKDVPDRYAKSFPEESRRAALFAFCPGNPRRTTQVKESGEHRGLPIGQSLSARHACRRTPRGRFTGNCCWCCKRFARTVLARFMTSMPSVTHHTGACQPSVATVLQALCASVTLAAQRAGAIGTRANGDSACAPAPSILLHAPRLAVSLLEGALRQTGRIRPLHRFHMHGSQGRSAKAGADLPHRYWRRGHMWFDLGCSHSRMGTCTPAPNTNTCLRLSR